MTIKSIAYRLAHESSIGVESLAARMGKGYAVLNNKLNPNSTTHFLTIAELEMLADFADGNVLVAEYFAQKSNAVVVQLPTDDLTSDMSLLDGFMRATADHGDFANKFIEAFADGVITTKEFNSLRAKLYTNISAQLGFLAKIEIGVK